MTQPSSIIHHPFSKLQFASSCYQAIATHVLLITLLCFSTQFAWARKKDKDQYPNLAEDIADHYIRSFASDAQDEEDEPTTAETAQKKPALHIRPPKLDAATKRKVLFHTILAKSKNFDRVQHRMEPVLNEYAWDDLKLFYGTPSDPGYHLLSRINRTTTTLGEAVLASLLATPTSNLEVLGHRQHIIQTFLDNPLAVDDLQSILQTYQEGEQSLLSFWTSTDPLYSKSYQNYLNTIYSTWFEWMNTSVSWLELNKRFFVDLKIIRKFFENWLFRAAVILISEYLVEARLQKKAEQVAEKINYGVDKILHASYGAVCQILSREIQKKLMGQPLEQLRNKKFSQRLLESFKKTIPFLHGKYTERDESKLPQTLLTKWRLPLAFLRDLGTCLNIYSSLQTYWQYASLLNNLALRMADIQNFIRVATKVSETIAASPALEKAYGKQLTSVRKLLAQAKTNTELGRLIHYLQHLPLQHWNYFLNNAGKLLVSYKLFVEYKDAFIDAMYELGQLDAYLSLATLMQEAKANGSNHAYTFVKFLNRKQKNTPYIKIDQMWNPFLDAKQAVGNSIEMDGAPGGVRNIILTGPDAGGKSIFLTGVINTLLLAHVAGIGPAQAIQLTPFNKINTYIDVTDDVATAQALFMAEVTRAQKHINIIKGLQPHEFSFTIFDEPFSGTNPTEGGAAEYSILESLGAYSNSLSLVATHYPTVMLLEEQAPDKGFANYKVYITRDSVSGKINYTYKIVPGKSNQAIAIDILEEQGFDTSMLKRAREIIAHPEQFRRARI